MTTNQKTQTTSETQQPGSNPTPVKDQALSKANEGIAAAKITAAVPSKPVETVGQGNDLSEDEKKKLERWEKKIATAGESFESVGQALAGILAERLYRATHTTFSDYCEQLWGFSRGYAYRQIKAAELVGQMSTFGDKDIPLPTTEGQARELSKLAKANRVTNMITAMRNAKVMAGTGRVTSVHVKQAVEALQEPKTVKPKVAKPKALPVSQNVLVLVAEAKQKIQEGAEDNVVVEILTRIETSLAQSSKPVIQAA